MNNELKEKKKKKGVMEKEVCFKLSFVGSKVLSHTITWAPMLSKYT